MNRNEMLILLPVEIEKKKLYWRIDGGGIKQSLMFFFAYEKGTENNRLSLKLKRKI